MRNASILLVALIILTAVIFSFRLSSEKWTRTNVPSKISENTNTKKDYRADNNSDNHEDNADERANEPLKEFDILVNDLQEKILANGIYATFTPDMCDASKKMEQLLLDNESLRCKAVEICRKLGQFHPLTIFVSKFFEKAWYDGLLPASYKNELNEYFESEDRRLKATIESDWTNLTLIIRSDKQPLGLRLRCVVEAMKRKGLFEDKNSLNELLELAQTSESRVLRTAILHHTGKALQSQRVDTPSDIAYLAGRIHDIGIFNSDVPGGVYDLILTTGGLIEQKAFNQLEDRLELQSSLLSDMMKLFIDEKSSRIPDAGISGALQYTFATFDWHVSSKHFSEGVAVLRGDFSEDLKWAAVNLICPANLSKDKSQEGADYKRQVSQVLCESLFNIKDPTLKRHVLRQIEKIGDDSIVPLLQSVEEQEKDAETRSTIREVIDYLKAD